MQIGFDAKRLFMNNTGLGSYSRFMVSNLQELYPQHKYHLYTPKAVKNKDTFPFFDSSKFIIHESTAKVKSYWRTIGIVKDLKRDNIDIYHGLSAELPYGISRAKIKSVVTIHDLAPITFPKNYNVLDRSIYKRKTITSCMVANKVIAISKSTQKDIIKYCNIDKEKVILSYLGIKTFFPNFKKELSPQIALKYSLPKRFMLFVGSVNERKNLIIVLEAIKSIPESSRIPLVVVGSGKEYLQKVKKFISKNNIGEYVHFMPYISNEELPNFYDLCDFFVYPSLYEGFGLPVLEAIYFGKTVITSNVSSLPEAAGNCGICIDPTDIDKWKKAILDFSVDGCLREMTIEEKNNHLEKFNYKNTTQEIMNIYLELTK